MRFLVFVLFAIAVCTSFSMPIRAQTSPHSPLQIVPLADGVQLEWRGDVVTTRAGNPTVGGWPIVAVNGVELPAQLVALRVPNDVAITTDIVTLRSVSWVGALRSVDQPVPQSFDGEPRPDLADPSIPAAPSSPVTVLQDGMVRGTRIVVLAVSPIFNAQGTLRAATSLDVTIPGAEPLDADATDLLARSTPFLADASGPTNAAATRALARIVVAEAGMQRLTGTTLAAAGVEISALTPAKLHVWHNGVSVALDERGTSDGQFDPADELWFYAPEPGDRWNATDTYWLTVEGTNGPRIQARDATPSGAAIPVSSTGLEQGTWRDNRIYDPNLPGPDGDHWYAIDLRTGPNQDPATLTTTLTPTLPLVTGNVALTVNGTAYTRYDHTLVAAMGSAEQPATWEGTGTWTEQFTLAATTPNIALTLVPGDKPAGVEIDSIAWERPVRLDFGGNGAFFAGRQTGRWQYDLAQTPSGRLLYDISDAATPTRLSIPNGTNPRFEDAPGQRYLLTGPGTLHTPAVSAHQAVNLAAPLNADVLYIAPAGFQDTLAPLVAHRQSQGHTVRIVSVQAIYDAWSYGQVSPDAIRDFLRYAAATWSLPPKAVTLVGDGTVDPHDYMNRGELNVNLVPPYLAMVDPWIGETACQHCYAQLNGDDPVLSPDADMFADLVIGRLPVKTTTELAGVVAKIVDYETNIQPAGWRSRTIFIADNYREADGAQDQAGNFAQIAEDTIALQPASMRTERVYYDPWQKDENDIPVAQSWHEPDAARARQQTFAAIDSGAALVTYIGHSNHWRWAVTDLSENNHLLQLFEADGLKNRERLPVILSMTCWTGAFHTPASSGTTLDERLFLNPNGGGVAVWGPAGLGVAFGHDALLRGFNRALWEAPSGSATLGELTLAGSLELLTNNNCCQEEVRTYILFGEPLTQPQVLPGANSTYLPLTQR